MTKGWLLSEKTLKLSEKKWNAFLSKSKASEKSKKRYQSERNRYKELKKQKDKTIKVYTDKKIQKEGFYGRSVWFARANIRTFILKRQLEKDVKQLKSIYSVLYSYKGKAKYIMLKLKYRVFVINGGKLVYGDMSYIGSHVAYANEFNYAYDNLIRKVKGMCNAGSIDGIKTYTESIKFYAGKRVK